MQTEVLTYIADGLQMRSQLYLPAPTGKTSPAILVFPEAFGLGEHAKMRAARLAELGYVALACDLYGDAARVESLEEVLQIIAPLHADPDRMRSRAYGGLEALCSRPESDSDRIAAIGFCFGGTMALELARSGAGIVGVVGFHCGLATVARNSSAIRAKVLVCIGADDPVVSPSERLDFEEEMRARGAKWRMCVYGGVRHSFTNPAAAAIGYPDLAQYDANADEHSWREMCGLFDEVFLARSH